MAVANLSPTLKKTNMKTVTLLLLLVALPLVTVGCFTSRAKPVPWNVSIIKHTTATIEVDLVGVTPLEKLQWMNGVKPGDYWKPNNSLRKGVNKSSKNLETGKAWVLKKEDRIWKDWLKKGATDLMIMANLPGNFEDSGPFDRRRVFIPLGKNKWKKPKDKTIEIEVQDGIINVLTPQKL